MLKSIASVILLASLSGCASLGDVFISGSNAAYALDQNGSSVSAMILKADLSKKERARVLQAQSKIYDLRDKFSAENLLFIHRDYLAAKTEYEAVYVIVVAHEDEYTTDEWQAFKDAHKVALKLDAAVNDYILRSNRKQAAAMGLQYLNAAAKLAAVL